MSSIRKTWQCPSCSQVGFGIADEHHSLQWYGDAIPDNSWTDVVRLLEESSHVCLILNNPFERCQDWASEFGSQKAIAMGWGMLKV